MIRSTGKRKVEIYRLMRFTFRDVPESKFGTKMAGEIFFQAGSVAGREFYSHFLSEATNVSTFVKLPQNTLKEIDYWCTVDRTCQFTVDLVERRAA